MESKAYRVLLCFIPTTEILYPSLLCFNFSSPNISKIPFFASVASLPECELHDLASLVAQLVKNPPAMWETWVQSLGWEKSPGEGKGSPLQYSHLENL